ncbi:DEAD/DEAH box helicase family protein [Pseudomonadales bacterium]|jgi:superfamily II DNA or RNA helicase|nr:DEAD/DEAH box helicase family protein [Pseudomonadales bacterium]
MKAVLSNRIYLEVNTETHNKIEKELTYTLAPRMPSDPPIVFKTIRFIREGLVSIPIGREDLIPSDYEIIDKRVTSPVEHEKFKFELRPSQKRVHDEVNDNAIINAWVSWGKTFTGLAIAAKLGQKTLVVTHTTNLRNQWEKEVQKCFGIEPGRIGSGDFKIDAPIVVGNIQSLYRKMDDIKQVFGTVILDEMHHVSSPTFTRIVDEMPARYKVGLTGTLERKDGRHVVFRDYFGNNVFKPPKENYLIPRIDIVQSDIRFLDGAYTPWAERINHLATNEEYVHSVSMIAAKYAAEGHKVLVVSDRVAFLKACAILCGDKAVHITGDMGFEEREDTMNMIKKDKNILFGTQSIFSEGISLNELSCLVLGTPINNEPLLTQLIGRVIRDKKGKQQPVVIDIHLKGKTAARQANARMGYYIKQDYEVNIL